MIHIQIPGFDSYPGRDGRGGDCQIMTDSSNSFALVIDSYCDGYADVVIDILKSRGLKKVYLFCTHPHYDHLDGLIKIMQDGWFEVQSFYSYAASSLSAGSGNSEIQADINYLNGAINLAKGLGIPTHYMYQGDKATFGEIKFNVYRQQDGYQGDFEDPHGWAFVNDGSLCFYFPELRYWTSGDGPRSIYDVCKANGAKPVIFKIPHHGGNCNAYESNGLVSLGAILCWDNSYNTDASDDFLKYGRRRCIEAGIKYIGIHGDINIVACTGHIHVYKDWQVYSFPCSYTGKNTFKNADAQIVQDVINGKAGKGNARMSYLINHGYNPLNVQAAVNKALSEPVEEGWIKNDKGWWYKNSDGSYCVGWAKLKCDWFYFDKNGYMVTGWLWDTDRKAWFYLDPASGVMWASKWLAYKGKKCWLKPSGRAAMSETITIDGKACTFDKDCYLIEAAQSSGTSAVKAGARVIDVSEFQPADIDWAKVKAGGYAVIVRIGLRGSIKGSERYRKIDYDHHYKKYVDGIIKAGIPYSTYFFPTPLSDAEADAEADWIITNVDRLKLSMPVYLDSERVPGGVANDISTAERTRYLKRITDKLVAAGIHCGIYASTSWLQNQINMNELQQQVQDNTWVAQYNTTCTYDGIYAMWQYTSKGSVDGINGNVDMSVVKRAFNMSCRKQTEKSTALDKDNVQIYPTTDPVQISNSGSDENGNYKGGKAGDNTGKEWYIRDWYNRPWNCVLRHPDAEVRACLADLAIKAAKNDRIGYDQYQRQTYWQQLQAVGYDPSKITTACEADCSAGVIANVKAAGHLLNKKELQNITCTYTGNMRASLKSAGFQCLTESKYLNGSSYLVAGDILLNDAHHTATAVTNGKNSGQSATQTGYQNKAEETSTTSTDDVHAVKYSAVVATKTDPLNIRLGPGTSYGTCSFSPLAKGTRVEVCNHSVGKWLLIKYAGKYGYAYSDYIAKI